MGAGWSYSGMPISRRKRVLGRELLYRQKIINLSDSGFRLGRADTLHLGRVCLHVYRSFDGYTATRQAQETVEERSCWTTVASLFCETSQQFGSPLLTGSSLKFADGMHMARLGLVNKKCRMWWPWMMVLGALPLGCPEL